MPNSTVTVTMNPCIDKTVFLSRLRPYGLNRVRRSMTDPSGKGINVSRVLAASGTGTLATGFIAGRLGELLLNSLKSSGIPYDFIPVDGETRTNLKIYDESAGKITEINEPGFPVPESAVAEFMRRFGRLSEGAPLAVFSGSLPPGAPDTLYRDCIRMAKDNGARTILDADAVPLREGITAVPYAVKPNLEELERLYGKKLTGIPEIAEAAASLISRGVELVAVSMGADGALVMDRHEAYKTEVYPAEIQSPTGAGDSMVAALAYCVLHGMPLPETAKIATAAGTETASLPGTQLCSLRDALKSAGKVSVSKVF